MFIVYTKEVVAKKVFDVNLDAADLQKVMKGDVFLDHKDLNPSDYVVVEQEFEYPTFDKDTIREMTLMERYNNKLYQLEENEVVLNNEIVKLEEGQYLDQTKNTIVTVPTPENLLKKVWDKVTHIWSEGATVQEVKDHYFGLINKYKAEILEVGFDFNGHQQKCREKDLALLGNAIAANEDAVIFSKTPVTHWSFNDGDVVEITVEELKKLRVDGATFVQAIFTVEATLKSKTPNVNLTKEEFINMINSTSSVKCYVTKI